MVELKHDPPNRKNLPFHIKTPDHCYEPFDYDYILVCYFLCSIISNNIIYTHFNRHVFIDDHILVWYCNGNDLVPFPIFDNDSLTRW